MERYVDLKERKIWKKITWNAFMPKNIMHDDIYNLGRKRKKYHNKMKKKI